MNTETIRDGATFGHWKNLPPRCVHMLCASNVAAMITGAETLTQNRKGQVTITYQSGHKEVVTMSDLNLCDEDDFVKTFQRIWKRKELGV